ncbi:MAG: hypothetical protein AB1726_09955 [Planctomycetota bacterium]
MRGIRSLPLLPILVLLAGAACASRNREPDALWQTVEVAGVPSDGYLWKMALLSCQKLGFPLAAGLDPSSMEITTGWRTDLQPFRGEGTRTQVHLRMTALGRGHWRIAGRVKKQVNEDILRPLDPRYADWKWREDDAGVARILVHHIRAYLDSRIDS